MSPAPSPRPRHAAKPIDDFDWPPSADGLSVYELGPDPWQKLQDASSQAYTARRREASQLRRPHLVERVPRSTRTHWPRTRAIVLAASAIMAVAAGWVIYKAMTRPLPVYAIHHPVPAAVVTAAPPPITIVATYPIGPTPPSTSLLGREPVVSDNGPAASQPGVSVEAPQGAIDPGPSGAAAAGTAGQIAPDPEPASQVTPVEAPAAADTMAAPIETTIPAVIPAAVDPGAKTTDGIANVRDIPGTGPVPR